MDRIDKAIIRRSIIIDIQNERKRQDKLWGEQNHKPTAWIPILMEEVGEVCHEINEGYKRNGSYREELIQVASVALQMLECFDRNER